MGKSVIIYSLFLLLIILTACSNNPGGGGEGSSSSTGISSSGSSKAGTHTVTYNAGIFYGIVPSDTNYYSAGQTVTVKYPADLIDPAQGGPNAAGAFAGWNTSQDGSGTSYQPGSSFVMDDSNVALYAQWQAMPASYQSSSDIDSIRNMDTRTILSSVPASVQSGVFTDPADNLPKLVNSLVSTASDPVVKMKYIHDWIVANIYYDQDLLNLLILSNYQMAIDPSPYTTLSNRRTVCIGFASLFASMCELAGLNAGIVAGILNSTNVLWSQHDWSIVQINGNPFLIDVTLDGENYYSNKTFFQAPYRSAYLFVPPQYFILDHLPVNSIYQGLSSTVSLAQFNATPHTFHGLSTLTSAFFVDGYTFPGTVTLVYQAGPNSASLQISLPAGTAPYACACTTYTNWYYNWAFFSRSGNTATIQMLPANPGYATVEFMDSCVNPTIILASFLVQSGSPSPTPDPFPYEYGIAYTFDFSLSSPMQGDLTAGSPYDFEYSAADEYESTLYYSDSSYSIFTDICAMEIPSPGNSYNFTAMVAAPPTGYSNILYIWMSTNSGNNYGPFYLGFNVIQTNSGTGGAGIYRTYFYKPPKIPEIKK